MSDEPISKSKKGEAKPGQQLKLPGFMQQLSPEQRAVVDSHLIADSVNIGTYYIGDYEKVETKTLARRKSKI